MSKVERVLYLSTYSAELDRHGSVLDASRAAQEAVIEWHRFNKTATIVYRLLRCLGLV